MGQQVGTLFSLGFQFGRQGAPTWRRVRRGWGGAGPRSWGLVLPQRGWVDGLSAGLQDPRMVPLQVAPTHLDGHLVVITELEEEVDGGVTAAGDQGVTAHHPVLARGVWSEQDAFRPCSPSCNHSFQMGVRSVMPTQAPHSPMPDGGPFRLPPPYPQGVSPITRDCPPFPKPWLPLCSTPPFLALSGVSQESPSYTHRGERGAPSLEPLVATGHLPPIGGQAEQGLPPSTGTLPPTPVPRGPHPATALRGTCL